MNINAFVDCGFPPGRDFSVKFLSSKEFTADILRGLISSGQRNLRKDEVASKVADALEKGKLTPNEVLLEYVKQPRTWLSIQIGLHKSTPTLNSPALLLSEFGEEGWYGPIQEPNKLKKYKLENLFKAHCYFGLKPNSTTQDCFEHLKCFMEYYGGSTGVLKFLLKELGL
ncbi:MAG: hypothetical protein IGS39_21135 [Calothrix sp. C42_A2020_038]|nr:hypothetical protein [Calothrix sp. C42_A2020_038]